jgi:hypothetical protein
MADAKVFDRVKETTATTGSAGVYTLGGAVAGYRAYSGVAIDGDKVFYVVEDSAGNWEVGAGVFDSTANTITRDWIDDSSNGGDPVDWPAGTKNIFCALPAEYHVVLGEWQQQAITNYLTWSGMTTAGTPAALALPAPLVMQPRAYSLLISAWGAAGVKAWTAQVLVDPGTGIVGTPILTPIAGTTGTETWGVAFSVTGAGMDELVITVNGDASSGTLDWAASATVL